MDIQETVNNILLSINNIILGKEKEIRLVLTCLLAKGHLLIEDIPGVGKTTLAQSIAKTLGLNFNRIQCTSDLLPADIIGTSVFDRTKKEFTFHKGPLFNNMILVDELNRASPRTQSSFLEAMEEQQISIDNTTYVLPDPFFVIATQNQRYHTGTFPIPESQLDRFLMRIQLGYPDFNSERKILTGNNRHNMIRNLKPVIQLNTFIEMQRLVQKIHISDPILDYIQNIITSSRNNPDKYIGLSPRAGIALVKASQAWAFTNGREMIIPEDVQAVAGSVLEHRLSPESTDMKKSSFPIVDNLIRTISLNN